jgi:hypothetical protein
LQEVSGYHSWRDLLVDPDMLTLQMWAATAPPAQLLGDWLAAFGGAAWVAAAGGGEQGRCSRRAGMCQAAARRQVGSELAHLTPAQLPCAAAAAALQLPRTCLCLQACSMPQQTLPARSLAQQRLATARRGRAWKPG